MFFEIIKNLTIEHLQNNEYVKKFREYDEKYLDEFIKQIRKAALKGNSWCYFDYKKIPSEYEYIEYLSYTFLKKFQISLRERYFRVSWNAYSDE